MTTPIVPSISDEQLAELEEFFRMPMFKDDANSPQTMGELRGLIARLRAAETERDQLCAQGEALHQIGHALGLPAGSDLTREALLSVEALHNLCSQANACLDRWAAGHAFDADKLGPWTLEDIRAAMERKP